MTRPKPRRMRPTMAWAMLSADGTLYDTDFLSDTESEARELKEEMLSYGWRIARVRITEIPSKRK